MGWATSCEASLRRLERGVDMDLKFDGSEKLGAQFPTSYMAGENLDLDHFFQELAIVVSGELPVLAVQDP
jgi:hypothetical protein